jgi:TnpA family transposase
LPVDFLSSQERSSYGCFNGDPSPNDLARYFYFNETDLACINAKYSDHARLGFALQLATVRYLGTFLEDPLNVPAIVLLNVSRQLGIKNPDKIEIKDYNDGDLQRRHAREIREQYGYVENTDHRIGLRLTRWLYNLCWIGNERATILFERAKTWMLVHKVLLPRCGQLERYIAHLRERAEQHLWQTIARHITPEQKESLKNLLVVPEGARDSLLVTLRKGPVRRSSLSLKQALERINSIRKLGMNLSLPWQIPQGRIRKLARLAEVADIKSLVRLTQEERLVATLAAFIHCLEATAQDDAMELLDILLNGIFNKAVQLHKTTRLRTLKDMDQNAEILADFCLTLANDQGDIMKRLSDAFKVTSQEKLAEVARDVKATIRPPGDVYYQELNKQYRSVRIFLPMFLEHLHFDATPSGKILLEACLWIQKQLRSNTLKPKNDAPGEVVGKSWQKHVFIDDDRIDLHAYVFCVLEAMRKAIRRREIFAIPSWHYADPRAGLLTGPGWAAIRPIVCRTLSLSTTSEPTLSALSDELDWTYRTVVEHLPINSFVRFENIKEDRHKLVMSNLEAVKEPDSLIALREAVYSRLPRVDLPEILLEIDARTGFTGAFTHISESASRAAGMPVSLCAVLMAEACNIGLKPLVRRDIAALKRDRLSWVQQNYIRNETLTAANAMLVSAHNRLELPHIWGGGDVASADGMRFAVPVRTIHAGPNPKYFGRGLGLTWYNLLSDQLTGLNAITITGTMRDSLVLLAVVLGQETHLQPTTIMTDTGAYSDVVFGLFRLLGYHFSPRLADIGDARLWRIDPQANYGDFDKSGIHKINIPLIAQQWEDILRLVGSLKLGEVSPMGIMHTLRIADKPTKLARAIAEIGRIEKTLHLLTYIDDEDKRRHILTQLNRGEARHSLARVLFHGQRGEIRHPYREGQEDQLGAMGLVLNIIVLWNTIYMEEVLKQLQRERFPVLESDKAHLSPLVHDHTNMNGKFVFLLPDAIAKGKLRPLRNPDDDD